VGGNVTEADVLKIALKINDVAGSVLVSNSKRTEIDVLEALENALTVPYVAYNFNLDGQDENPYLAMIGAADAVVVTADSARMLSQICSGGKIVYIYTPEQLHFSYAALRDSLIEKNYAHDFDDLRALIAPTKLLAEAKRVAELLAQQLKI